ncbi:Fic family protein [Isoptericola haloaureus]|uniref:Fic family protein n=1 Tax=Isoptericola haloaureus TaxID=1542902 RepID=A0ABU7Z5C1_9MICO
MSIALTPGSVVSDGGAAVGPGRAGPYVASSLTRRADVTKISAILATSVYGRSMTWSAERPHDDLPTLPPQVDLETRAVLKATIEARDALARFDARALALPNPTVLINAILLLEAQASSEIENIVTTTDELFTAAVTDVGATPTTREALRYRSALHTGFQQVGRRQLTANTAAEVCADIRGYDEGFRRGEVFIGDPATRKRVYTPPSGPALGRLLDDWSEFLNAPTDLDPLVRMAVAHYQFEAIHPFTDGNGRTGRIMNVLMLCDAGLLHLPVLYLSRYIIESKDEYYRLLRDVTSDGAWEPWVRYIVDGVRETAERTTRVVDGIQSVQEALLDLIRTTVGSANGDLLAVLMEQPYARVRDVMARCGVSRPTASKWLHGLVDAGALADLKVGREVLYINVAMMDVLRG